MSKLDCFKHLRPGDKIYSLTGGTEYVDIVTEAPDKKINDNRVRFTNAAGGSYYHDSSYMTFVYKIVKKNAKMHK